MTATLRVSLAPALKGASLPAQLSALDPVGPLVCLGAAPAIDGLALPVQPDASSLFGPRGACLQRIDGPLWVCDSGHHRLLGWAQLPLEDGDAADWLIGQPDFFHEGRNAKGRTTAQTFNVPTGITCCEGGLAVADAWNHRILIWQRAPRASHVPADIVLGQANFESNEANRGAVDPSGETLFWPYGVHWDGARLWVCDSGNRRVLMWRGLPRKNGQAADLVLGQAHFALRDENGGGEPCASSMRWPHAIAIWSNRLCVADAGNNRVMVWEGIPEQNNRPCDHLLGQSDCHKVDHNQSLYWPTSATLNMPYGIASADDWLLVADTASSRVIAWHAEDCESGAPARALTGQSDFHAKGDNRWRQPVRDSLCWPYGVMHCGGHVVVADSGNNRVLIWKLSSDLTGRAS